MSLFGRRRRSPEVREEPRKKAYYSPGEVRRRHGCIGCGGMALSIALVVAAWVTALVLP